MAKEKKLIYADAFRMYLEDIQAMNRGWNDGVCDVLDDVMAELDEQPAVDAGEAVRGRWVFDRKSNTDHRYKCTVCGFRLVADQCYNYCPHCGAKMDG